MKKLYIKILIVTGLLTLLAVSTLLTYLYFKEKRECNAHTTYCNQAEVESEVEKIRNVQKAPKAVEQLSVEGWIPDWDFDDGFMSLQEQYQNFSSISPFWYSLQEDGSLTSLRGAEDSELIAYTKEKEIDLVPTITSFDANTLDTMLQNESARNNHLETIVQKVIDYNLQGIDLDYESIYISDGDLFFTFLKELALKLHQNQKKLVFTVVSKWGDKSVLYTSLPQTRRTFDYSKIAGLVDELRVMTYDFTSRTSKYYGPVGPITWMEDVVRYAIYTGVPRNKLVLGIPTYGFEFSDRPEMKEVSYYPVLNSITDEKLPEAFAYYHTSVEKILNTYTVDTVFNDLWGEVIGTYFNSDNEKRILVYPTQRSIDLRKKLAADYGISGITYWRIGDEGSLIY